MAMQAGFSVPSGVVGAMTLAAFAAAASPASWHAGRARGKLPPPSA
jgi:hypothetical protein